MDGRFMIESDYLDAMDCLPDDSKCRVLWYLADYQCRGNEPPSDADPLEFGVFKLCLKISEKFNSERLKTAERVRKHRERKALERDGNVTVTACNDTVTLQEKERNEKEEKEKNQKKENKELRDKENIYIPPIIPQNANETEPKAKPKGEYSDAFIKFWDMYPKKVAKQQAWKSWQKFKLDSKVDEILTALSKQRMSNAWLKDNGQFIPHPTTWLNQQRWEDEGYVEPTMQDYTGYTVEQNYENIMRYLENG